MGTLSKIIIYCSLPPFLPPPLKLCSPSAAAFFFFLIAVLYTSRRLFVYDRRDTSARPLKRWFYSTPYAWAAEVWRHASCSVFHLHSQPLPQVSGHTSDQAGASQGRGTVPITPQCSKKKGKKAGVEAKRLVEGTACRLFL